jgi:hypothetical protein
LQLLVENAEYYRAVTLDYADGERYPHLARIDSTPDRIGDIFKAKVAEK